MMKRKTIAVAVSIISLLSFLAINAATAAEYAVDPYTVALWHLNEGDGFVANDETGVNDGAICGATWTTGKYGSALYFDGINDYIKVEDDASLHNQEMTVETWVRVTLEARRQVILRKSIDSVWGSFSLQIEVDNKVLFTLQDETNGDWPVWKTVSVLTSDEWYHIAATFKKQNYDSTDGKIYINGTEQTTTFVPNGYNDDFAIEYTNQGLFVGSQHGTKYPLKGVIDEVRISNVVRTPVDIEPGAEVVNLKSHANWFTAYLELFGNDPSEVDLYNTILWFDAENGAYAECDEKYGFVSDPAGYTIDIDGDGVYERMVKFDRFPTIDSYLDKYIGQEITLTVEYTIGANTYYASYTVKVMKPGKS